MVPLWRGYFSVLCCWEKGISSFHRVTLIVSDPLVLACLGPGQCALVSTEMSLLPLILLNVTLAADLLFLGLIIVSAWEICESVTFHGPSRMPFLSTLLSPSWEPGHHCFEVSPAHLPEPLSINVATVSAHCRVEYSMRQIGDLHARQCCPCPLHSLMCSNLYRRWFFLSFPTYQENWKLSGSSDLPSPTFFFLSCHRSGVF